MRIYGGPGVYTGYVIEGGVAHGEGVFVKDWGGGIYEGSFRDSKLHGVVTYKDKLHGDADVSKWRANRAVGEGVRWSKDRSRAQRLMNGVPDGPCEYRKDISLEKAMQIMAELGVTVPMVARVEPVAVEPVAPESTRLLRRCPRR